MTKSIRALIALTSVVILNFSLPQCKQARAPGQIDEVDVRGVVLFKVGDVKLNDKQIEVGDLVSGDFEIKVGPQSLCDLQIKQPELAVTMRIKANTVVVLSAQARGASTVIRPSVRIGRLMLRTGKLGPGQEIEVSSRTAMASVRGTDFEMNVTKQGGGVTVVSGKVAVRPRIPALENFPADVVEKSPALRKVVAALQKQEVVLDKGGFLPTDTKYTDRIMKAVPGLKKLLDSPALKAVAGKSKVDPAAAQAAAQALESGLKEADLAGKIAAATEKDAKDNPPKPVIIKDEELRKKLQEYNELISMEQEKLRNAEDPKAAVEEFNKKRRPALLKQIARIMDKDQITVVLKNGTKVSGVLVPAKDGEYLVLTPEGTKRFPRSQVSHVEY